MEQRSGWFGLGSSVAYGLVCWLLLLGPTGQDWELMVACLAEWPIFLHSLPWLGVVGCSALLWGLCSCCLSFHAKERALGFGMTILWLGSSWFQAKSPTPEFPKDLRVAVLRTDWSQDKKWDESSRRDSKEKLIELSREAAQGGAKLVVWPETAWPFRGLRRRPKDTRLLGRFARKQGIHIMASSIEDLEDGESNSVSHITDRGRFAQEYVKRRLAPFAEYIPVPRSWEEKLRQSPVFNQISRFKPGQEEGLFQADEHAFATLICYESMKPDMAADYAGKIDFFVVMTNEAPLINSAPQKAHFRSAILRAAQFRRPVFQASNQGFTGVIGPRGRVRKVVSQDSRVLAWP